MTRENSTAEQLKRQKTLDLGEPSNGKAQRLTKYYAHNYVHMIILVLTHHIPLS